MIAALFPLLVATVGIFLVVGIPAAFALPQWPRRVSQPRRPMFAGPRHLAGGVR